MLGEVGLGRALALLGVGGGGTHFVSIGPDGDVVWVPGVIIEAVEGALFAGVAVGAVVGDD